MTNPTQRPLRRRSVLRAAAATAALGAASGLSAAGSSSDDERTKTITGRIEDDAPDWVYVPFEVPAGVTELHVEYEYNESEENVLDIGVFDPDGYDLGNVDGFRGWSGGARSEFSISRAAATPGYVPGPIESGTWHVILGPYKVSSTGIDYELTITMRSVDPGPAFEPDPAPTALNDEAGWYRGDIHLHTVHSDGQYTPSEVVSRAADADLDFVVPTDHNTPTANLVWGEHARSDLLVINGEEPTTRAGHYSAIGLEPGQWIDWRYLPEDDQLPRFVEEVRDVGGFTVAQHPFCPYKGCDWRFGYEHVDTIEVWNGPWTADDDRSVELWDELLRDGLAIPAVGGSDSHGPDRDLGHPQMVVRAPRLAVDAILPELKAGRSYVAASTDVALRMSVRAGRDRAEIGETVEAAPDARLVTRLRVVGAASAVATLHTQEGTVKTKPLSEDRETVTVSTRADEVDYVRAEVRDSEGAMVALTNPVFVRRSTPA
ncbi:CehA/McbA family metallohydrolase [Halegenticoccus tardaugens]|uniref:CehA/McbA family metallohydrolase n=1 Tax=Halegenticoccus tardaugens TaxID=2071624 RepID=UPI00100BD99B|nr:CehA/McbA family metallohydrolase [Halegenticoccus tardaugens]